MPPSKRALESRSNLLSRRLAICIAASFIVATLLFVGGLIGLPLLILALNGFSERAALPIFAGYGMIVLLAGFALAAAINGVVLKSGGAPLGQALAGGAAVAGAVVFPLAICGALVLAGLAS